MIPVVLSCSGDKLRRRERQLFAAARPWGFILFSHNCRDYEQIKQLIADLKECSPEAHILIDEEGGRVTRLPYPSPQEKPPAAAHFGGLYRRHPRRAVKLAEQSAAKTARLLMALGIDVNCAPVVDMAVEGAHQVIGDRSFGDEAGMVIQLAKAMRRGFAAAGLTAMIKHIPGHGRATADSHVTLPVVEAPLTTIRADAEPFTALADTPMAMTAHVAYPAIDGDAPATFSAAVIEFIRDELKFGGTIITDAIEMDALTKGGDLAARAELAWKAGCDVVLYGGGGFADMKNLLANSRYG